MLLKKERCNQEKGEVVPFPLQLATKVKPIVTQDHDAQQVRTKQEEVDYKEEVLAVLLERYAVSSGAAVADNLPSMSHANLGVLGPIRQGSLTALSKASLAPSTDSKGTAARPTPGDVKRLGSSRGRLDIKVTCHLLEIYFCLLVKCRLTVLMAWTSDVSRSHGPFFVAVAWCIHTHTC